MRPSSRTPEGSPRHCPVCGQPCAVEPSAETYDAPCPHCGSLLWFTPQANLIPQAESDDTLIPEVTLPENLQIPSMLVELVTVSLARSHKVMPIGWSGDTLVLAMADPSKVEVVDMLRFVINQNLLVIGVSEDWIRRQIDIYYPV